MKRAVLFTLILATVLAARVVAEPALEHLWSQAFVSTGTSVGSDEDECEIVDFAVDSGGNTVLLGHFVNEVDLGGATYGDPGLIERKVFLAKYDSDGTYLWSHEFGNDLLGSYAGGLGIDDNDNITIGGGFRYEIDLGGGLMETFCISHEVVGFLAKYTPSGVHMWSQMLPGCDDIGLDALATDTAGNIVFGGNLYGAVNLGGTPLTPVGSGSHDIYLARFDAIGNHLWSQTFGTDESDFISYIELDTSGRVLLTGSTHAGAIDLGGGAIDCWTGGGEEFLAKYDTDGTHLWSRCWDGSPLIWALETDPQDNVLIGGYFTSQIDFGGGVLGPGAIFQAFVAKYDAAGNHAWSRTFSPTDPAEVFGLGTDSDGDVFVSGWFFDSIDFGGVVLENPGKTDFFAKLTAGGVHIASGYHSNTYDYSRPRLRVDSAGDVIGANVFDDSVDLGGGLFTNTSFADLYLVKFNGNLRPTADAGQDQYVMTDDTVQLDSTADDPDGDPLQWQWSWVDLPFGSIAELDDPTAEDPSFTTDVAGTYVLSLTVSDGMDPSEPDEVEITAEPPCTDPVPILDIDPTSGDAPLEVTFNSLDSYDPYDNMLFFEWDFGDGTPVSSEPYIQHTYADAGDYDASLYLSNDCGHGVFVPVDIHVDEPSDVPGGGPLQDALRPNVPNPFNPVTVINYELARETSVELVIYDVNGKQVRRLKTGAIEGAGRHEVRWDGRDDAGRAAPAGVYVYRLQTPQYEAARRMTLLK